MELINEEEDSVIIFTSRDKNPIKHLTNQVFCSFDRIFDKAKYIKRYNGFNSIK